VAELPDGFEGYVADRGPALLRFAYLLTGGRALAEDMVQEALIKVCTRWDRVVAADAPDAYVRRVVLNEFLRWKRRRASHEIVGAVQDRDWPGDGRNEVDQVVERDAVWRALLKLPRRQRSVLVLRYYESLPYADIASLLGCTEGTARSLASRAFDALRCDTDLARDPLLARHGEET
jgi:RNA polymerase sigma-70 factor (sigma-E family)